LNLYICKQNVNVSSIIDSIRVQDSQMRVNNW